MESVHLPGLHAEPDVHAPKRSKGSWLRVSIRELLLITTAAGAITALVISYVQQRQPIEPTRIPEKLKDFEQVRVVCQRLNRDPYYFHVFEVDAPEPPGDDYYDPHHSTHAYSTRIQLPDRLRDAFMEELKDEFQAVLEQNAEVAHTGAKRDGHRLEHFDFGYRVGKTEGRLFVRTLGLETDRIEILLFIHEFHAK